MADFLSADEYDDRDVNKRDFVTAVRATCKSNVQCKFVIRFVAVHVYVAEG